MNCSATIEPQQHIPVVRGSAQPHHGMPPLEEGGPPLSFFEFWPMWAFYGPMYLYAAWLMLRFRGVFLPTAANPSFPGGGFYGEEKSKILALAVKHIPEWVAPFVRIERSTANTDVEVECDASLAALAAAGIELPVVAKPDLGCRGAGVQLIQDRSRLVDYIQEFPRAASFVLQRLVPFEGEAGIFYCRRAGETSGRVTSITLKYFPYVTGDGRRTLRDLILASPRAGRLAHLYFGRHRERLDQIPKPGESIRLAFAGSHSRGAIFRDGTRFVTPEMEARFDEIAKRLPEFHFGRFDVRFQRFADLQAGHGFTILEINGAGAESTHIWDRNARLFDAWRVLSRQYRWLFEIGAENRARGFAPMNFRAFISAYKREKHLTPLYPATD